MLLLMRCCLENTGFCSDKPDSLAGKPDIFEQERDEEGVTGPSSQKALLLY
jgi:hypothetical protein